MKSYLVKVFLISLCMISWQVFGQSDSSSAPTAVANIGKYKDWALRCVEDEVGKQGRCRLFQRLILEENKRVVLQAMIVLPKNVTDPANAVFVLPLGLHLPSGIKLRVDSGEVSDLQVERCFPQGCTARILLDRKMLASFKEGNIATVIVRERPTQDVNLRVSLAGFSAGYKALLKAESKRRN